MLKEYEKASLFHSKIKTNKDLFASEDYVSSLITTKEIKDPFSMNALHKGKDLVTPPLKDFSIKSKSYVGDIPNALHPTSLL